MYGGGSGNTHTVTQRPRTPKQRVFYFLNFEKMEIEKTAPAKDTGKMFIEVDPDTARGIEAIDWKQMFFQALTFIYATRSIEGFEQHLMLTQGHNFLDDIKCYIKTGE